MCLHTGWALHPHSRVTTVAKTLLAPEVALARKSTRPEGLYQSLTLSTVADKTSCEISKLQPLLSPRLRQDGLTPDEAAPLLAKIHIKFLRQAGATANWQVLTKLITAEYQKPALKKLRSSLSLSWDVALPSCMCCKHDRLTPTYTSTF